MRHNAKGCRGSGTQAGGSVSQQPSPDRGSGGKAAARLEPAGQAAGFCVAAVFFSNSARVA